MEILKNYLTRNVYSRPGYRLGEVTKIAVHYVGNAGSSAQANRNYFESLKTGRRDRYGNLLYASSHYIIGLDGEIVQCIPESEWSYATNQANGYSISIENCHAKADGKFNEKTLKSLRELCADICRRYGLDPIRDIIRHYDVSGKPCPLYWVNNPKDFVKFKEDVKRILEGEDEMIEKTTAVINGKEYEVSRILKDGRNYVALADFKQAGFEVSYDAETKIPSIANEPKELHLTVDGKETSVEAVNINGSNFVPIRSLSSATAAFDVDYIDGEIRITVNSRK